MTFTSCAQMNNFEAITGACFWVIFPINKHYIFHVWGILAIQWIASRSMVLGIFISKEKSSFSLAKGTMQKGRKPRAEEHIATSSSQLALLLSWTQPAECLGASHLISPGLLFLWPLWSEGAMFCWISISFRASALAGSDKALTQLFVLHGLGNRWK